MSVDESWHEPSHLQWFISNFTYENLLGYRLPFPTSSSLSLHLETGWCGRLTDYLEALFISLVFPRGVMKPLLQRAVPATPGKALAVPTAGLCCSALKDNCVPHFEGTPQFLTSRESAHQSAQDLWVWEAEWSREFPCLTLIETTSISLAGGKLPVILRRAEAWTMLKKASHHTNSIITFQSAFFSLLPSWSSKCWGLVLLQRIVFLLQEFCTHLFFPNCSCPPRPYGFVRPNQPDPGAPAILHFGPWTGQTAAKLNRGHWFHKWNASLEQWKNTYFPC